MTLRQNCSLDRLNDLFKEKDKIAIVTHEKPDVDALSSLVILRYQLEKYFNKNGKKVIDIYADVIDIDPLYEPILKKHNLNGQKVLGQYDLTIGVDCTDPSRCGSFQYIFNNAKQILNLDHHQTNSFYGNDNFVFNTSSTSELLYMIMAKLEIPVDEPIARLVYAGIITDTNNLTQGEVNSNTYSIINRFIKRGINLEEVKDHFFKNNPLSKLKLLERALHSLTTKYDGKLAIMRLNKSDYVECDANPETDTLGIVDYAINIKDVKIAMILLKQDDNTYKISLRSKDGINVADIAKKFGGGGHENMAVFTSSNISEFKDEFMKICGNTLKHSPNNEDVSHENLFFKDDEEDQFIDF